MTSMLASMLQVNLLDDHDQSMSDDWNNMLVTGRRALAHAAESHRLRGLWAMNKLYSATLRDNKHRGFPTKWRALVMAPCLI